MVKWRHQLTCSVEQMRSGHHAQRAIPATTKPLVTAAARLMREFWQLELLLMRKQLWVKVLNLIDQSIIIHLTLPPYLSNMLQQSPQQEPYLSYLLSSSRKHPLTPTSPAQSPTEFIVTAQTLKETVSKIINDVQSNQKQQEHALEALLNQLESMLRIESSMHLSMTQRSHVCLNQVKEKIAKSEQRQQKCEKELAWFNNKVKTQLKDIQKLKQQLRQSNKQQFDQSRSKVQPPPSLNPNFNTITLNHSQIRKKPHLTLRTQQSEETGTLVGVSPFEFNQVSPNNANHEAIKYKQALSQKDEIVRLLGEKCLQLQAHIQKLTRRYIGDVTINTGKAMQGALQTYPMVVRKRSEVELSGALRPQQEEDI